MLTNVCITWWMTPGRLRWVDDMGFKLMKKQTLKGFTLVEMVVVLIIAGIIVGGVMKGRDAMESAKVVATIEEIKNLQASVISYQSDYGYLPGDDKNASEVFGSAVTSGTGNGQVDTAIAWEHLKAAGLIIDVNPTASIGGRYTLVYQPFTDKTDNYLMLSADGNGKGAITPKQAQKITSKARDGGGMIQIHDGKATGCFKGSKLDLSNESEVCVVLVPLR